MSTETRASTDSAVNRMTDVTMTRQPDAGLTGAPSPASTLSRRAFLAGSAAGATLALAGCATGAKQRRIHLGTATLRPPDAQLRAAQGHDKLIIGIRPEHLTIGDGELTVKVALVEDLGSDSYIYGHLADDAASSVIVRSGRDHPRHGDTVKVGVDTAHLHMFDAATGLRVGE